MTKDDRMCPMYPFEDCVKGLQGNLRQWSKRMYLCGFVALSVWMCVPGANKVEGTMS